MNRSISVRLEGGIGEHIQGMRILPFIRQRYPDHKIIAYSDAGGHEAPLEVARMSPFFTNVIPIYHKKRFPRISTWGSLNNIQQKYIDMMFSSALFFDTWGSTFFIEQSKVLNVPFYEILAHPPELRVPEKYQIEAGKILARYSGHIFIGLNVSKYGIDFLSKNKKVVLMFIRELLKNPRVIILNFYTSSYKFPHWPKPLRIERELFSKEDIEVGKLWNIDARVLPLVDTPILIVAGLLQKCNYFIGVDNGIKHLAWALSIPHTFFIPKIYNNTFILRWIPDYNRSLLFSCSKEDLSEHLLAAKQVIHNRYKNKNVFRPSFY